MRRPVRTMIDAVNSAFPASPAPNKRPSGAVLASAAIGSDAARQTREVATQTELALDPLQAPLLARPDRLDLNRRGRGKK
jgi:hypothetical protein